MIFHCTHVASHNPTSKSLRVTDSEILMAIASPLAYPPFVEYYIQKLTNNLGIVWKSTLMLKDDTLRKLWHCIQFLHVQQGSLLPQSALQRKMYLLLYHASGRTTCSL